MEAVAAEGRWALETAAHQLRTAWRWWVAVAVVVGLLIDIGQLVIVVSIVGFYFMMGAWSRFRPETYSRFVSDPIWRSRTKYWIRESWIAAMVAAKLEKRTVARDGSPAVSRLKARGFRWHGNTLLIELRLAIGMTEDEVKAGVPSLRSSFGAQSAKLVYSPGLALEVQFRDSLEDSCVVNDLREPAELPAGEAEVGLRDDGAPWILQLQSRHTLIAGASGAGKSSLFWALATGLGPQVSKGLTRLHGIDLKGGVELAMGQKLFCRIATDQERAVLLLEDVVDRMRSRMARMSGKTRQHIPEVGNPLEIVVVDEIAALIAYVTDRELQKRAKEAVSIICSQGRAIGFVMVACLQDPRKETVPNRGLFTQMIGLRLKDREETVMVLGDGSVLGGAACHKIPSSMPGVGYLVPDGGGDPIRVRARYLDDASIRELTARYSAPEQLPVPDGTVENGSGNNVKAESTSDTNRKPRRKRPPRRENDG